MREIFAVLVVGVVAYAIANLMSVETQVAFDRAIGDAQTKAYIENVVIPDKQRRDAQDAMRGMH